MSGLLAILSIVFLLATGLTTRSLFTDIQIGIFVTCASAACVLMGLASTVRRLNRLERMLKAAEVAPLARVEPKI